MTFWDFVDKNMEKGLPWVLAILFLIGIIWFIAHPSVAKEWNVQISTWIAGIVPRTRKRTFEKRIDLTVSSVREKMSESLPHNMQRFLPYDLKVEWVENDEDISTTLKDNQVIVYVSSYKDEAKQTIGILHNYCITGFASKAKLYMTSRTKDAADLVMTERLVQKAGHHIYDYFNREYVPEIVKRNPEYMVAYENLKKIDQDGLFIPIFINEIEKYANAIYPMSPSEEIQETITSFANFIMRIVRKEPGENVDLVFNRDCIKIKIVLAISDLTIDLQPIIHNIEELIENRSINTFYILATGSKMEFANDIATAVYERNPQGLFEPIITQYTRYSRNRIGNSAVCFELNTR